MNNWTHVYSLDRLALSFFEVRFAFVTIAISEFHYKYQINWKCFFQLFYFFLSIIVIKIHVYVGMNQLVFEVRFALSLGTSEFNYKYKLKALIRSISSNYFNYSFLSIIVIKIHVYMAMNQLVFEVRFALSLETSEFNYKNKYESLIGSISSNFSNYFFLLIITIKTHVYTAMN